MADKADDVAMGAANKYGERAPLGASAPLEKDYVEPGFSPFIDRNEFRLWSFWRAGIAEFFATFLFLYIALNTVMGQDRLGGCNGVGIQGIAWAFGGMIFVLVYCTAGISGGHINPAVTFGLFLARKVSLPRAVFYIICQCLGAICGAGVVKGFQPGFYEANGGGANQVAHGYTRGDGLGAEIVGTFVLVYTVFSATDAKRSARDSHVPGLLLSTCGGVALTQIPSVEPNIIGPVVEVLILSCHIVWQVLAPLPIGFAVYLVHLATIPITGTGINPARSLGAAVIFNRHHNAWNDQWIFWVGPLLGATLAAMYHMLVIRAIPFSKTRV